MQLFKYEKGEKTGPVHVDTSDGQTANVLIYVTDTYQGRLTALNGNKKLENGTKLNLIKDVSYGYIWRSYDKNDQVEKRAMHTGLEVTNGVKIILTAKITTKQWQSEWTNWDDCLSDYKFQDEHYVDYCECFCGFSSLSSRGDHTRNCKLAKKPQKKKLFNTKLVYVISFI